MNEKTWIIAGLIIGVGIFSFPLWYNFGHKSPSPNIVISDKAAQAGGCILPGKAMRADHMHILDEWREQVVRNGERNYVAPDGKGYNMSLSNTCLECHDNKEEFCDRCHSYASVRTYCWDCHVNPAKDLKETAQWKTVDEISLK